MPRLRVTKGFPRYRLCPPYGTANAPHTERFSKLAGVVLLGLGLVYTGLASPAAADTTPPPRMVLEDTLTGPLNAIVTRVIDGDTVEVEVQTWLKQSLITSVRVDGIDTPELRGKCPEEKDLARAAKARVQALFPVGSPVILRNIRLGKYAARVVADLYTPQDQSLAAVLLAEDLARPYDGRSRRQPWCP